MDPDNSTTIEIYINTNEINTRSPMKELSCGNETVYEAVAMKNEAAIEIKAMMNEIWNERELIQWHRELE